MSVRFPPKLIPGDLIAITAPSSGVPQHLHPRLELAIGNLKKKVLEFSKEGACVRSTKIKALKILEQKS